MSFCKEDPGSIVLSSEPDTSYKNVIESLRDAIDSVRSEPEDSATRPVSEHPYKTTVWEYFLALREEQKTMEEETGCDLRTAPSLRRSTVGIG